MISVLVAIVIVLVLVVVGLLCWLISLNSANKDKLIGQQTGIGMLGQQLEALKSAQDDLRGSLTKSLQDGQSNISRGVQTSQEVLDRLKGQIGELQGTNKQMLAVGNEVKRLQTILTGPKLRGQMGEWSLSNLLSQILPKDSYVLQYGFRDGKMVDALVKMRDFSVPVDAKFPLPGFELIMRAENDDDRVKARKQFHRDVISHIDKIADSYIRPAEGTLDFALMYIPAENIYYETIVKYEGDAKDILKYALDKKVVPVSPNLLYAYLMTVVMGLHGLQIEKQAAEIRQNLKKLNASFSVFVNCWDVLGKHIRNAGSQYEEGGQRLNKFAAELEHTQDSEK